MNAPLSDRLIAAIESGTLDVEALPQAPTPTSAETDIFAIVLKTAGEEVGRVGVWKTSSGGTFGEGAPRVLAVDKTVHVIAGDRMPGSFDIECHFATQAEDLADLLHERLRGAYDEIEVEIVNS